MFEWLALTACAARTPVMVGPPVQSTDAFLLTAFGKDLAGMAVVSVEDHDWALLALGMMMVAPATISLPIKVLMFVLIDGWSLIMQGLLGSFS